MDLTIEELQNFETEIVKEIASICKKNNLDYFLHCGSALGAIRHGGPIPWDTDVDIIVPYNQYEKLISTLRSELSEKFYLDYYDNNKYYTPLFARVGLKGYSTDILHVDIFRLIGTSSNKSDQIKQARKFKKLHKIYFLKIVNKNYKGQYSFKTKLYYTFFKLLYLRFSLKKIRQTYDALCDEYNFEKADYVTNPAGHYGMKNIMPKSYYGKGIYVKYAGFEVKIPEMYDSYLKQYYGDYMKLPPENHRKIKYSYKITKL